MITFELKDNGLTQSLEALSRSVSDLTPAMEMIGDALVNNIQLGFHDETDPWGHPWKALSPSTIEARRVGPNKNNPDMILQDTGILKNSVNSSETNASQVVVGPAVYYGGPHQFGDGIPARPFLPLDDYGVDLPDEWRFEIMDIIQHHLLKATAK